MRPTAFIMKDQWFGHRDLRGREIGDPDGWTRWDYALSTALQIIEDSTDQHGVLAYQTEAEWVEVEAVKKINKFESAKQRLTGGKNYRGSPGEVFVPRVFSRSSSKGIPTFREYQEMRRLEREGH